jgi:acyl dehydratase
MSVVDITKYLGKTAPTVPVSYTRKDLILYAIGIGCQDLNYVYENHPQFCAFPTYPIVLGFKGTDQDVVSFPSPVMAKTMIMPNLPGFKFVLDGERYLEVINPLPLSGEFQMSSKLIGIHKRGSGALVVTESMIFDSDKTYVKIISGAFCVGAKNFSPESLGESYSENISTPSREADGVEETTTTVNQAQIYRLSGDYNPLHVDPRMAKLSGFKEPILHGLCSFGIAARAVIKHFCDGDASRFKSIKVRFSKPVIPGETLVTSMWKEGSKIVFEVKSKERNEVLVNNACAVVLENKAKL